MDTPIFYGTGMGQSPHGDYEITRCGKLLNKDKNFSLDEQQPRWIFDTEGAFGKTTLDFDGAFVTLQSRFSMPIEGHRENWMGEVYVLVCGVVVRSKSFECGDLTELKDQVEAYSRAIGYWIKERLGI